MNKHTPWIQRHFSLGLPVEMLPNIIERLRGTPARVEDRIGDLPKEILVRRHERSWSIQENVGHLLDLETLWHGRLDDYENGLEMLRPADMENRRTHDADHNAKPLQDLLADFRESRMRLIARLESFDDATLTRTTMHPRLNQPMKIVDLMFFTAEHDDHHMARITELLEIFGMDR